MKNRVVLIVQARMASTRLPGKSMMLLAGQPMLGRILERLTRCSLCDQIVLAIPDTEQDLVLQDLGRQYGIPVVLGSEEDVLDRYVQAATEYGADFVVRFPADNATPEPSEIDRIVAHHLSLGRPGFSSNMAEIWQSGYPDGIGAEIVDFSLLAEACNSKPCSREREHVHLNFFDYVTQEPVDELWCPVSTVSCPTDFRRPDIVLDVNTATEYKRMAALYRDLYPQDQNFDIRTIIRWFDDRRGESVSKV